MQDLGTIPASQAARGLGFNIDSTQPWEFQMAQAVGSAWVRFDCPWLNVEIQTPANTSGGYRLPQSCAAGLENSGKYSQHPVVNALYGPPYHQIAALTLKSQVAPGQYTLPVSTKSGDSLDALAKTCFDGEGKPVCELHLNGGKQVTKKWDYSGSLVTAVGPNPGSVTLAASTTVSLHPGDTVVINQLLYSPVLMTMNGPFLTDHSTQAYTNYAEFLAHQIATAHLTGEVGLWNEPPWSGGLWIQGQLLYDNVPAKYVPGDVVYPTQIALGARPPVPGVGFMSNWPNKSGALDPFAHPDYIQRYTSISNFQKNITSAAIHPYGNNPEEQMWSTPCLQVRAKGGPSAGQPDCALVGGNRTSNFKSAIQFSFMPNSMGGVRHSISETGVSDPGQKRPLVDARFDLRQFIGFQALGVSPVIFHRLTNSGEFDWINAATQTPYQNYKDFAALMKDINGIATAPINAPSACSSVQVLSFAGSFPLDVATFVGRRNTTDAANSLIFFSWQASYANGGSWSTMPSPAPSPASIRIPSGMNVVKVIDTVTLMPIHYDIKGTTLTYSVADDPIELLLYPSGGQGCTFGRT